MTGTQIKTPVDTFVGEVIDNAEALIGINEGISKMGPIVEVTAVSTAYVKNVWTNLPTACIKVTEVNIDDDYNTIYLGYRISSNGQQIMMIDSENYIVHYTREPIPLAVITDTPEMHVAYHKCLTTYLKGWYKYKEAIDAEEKLEGLKFMDTDFYNEIARIKRSLGNKPMQMIAQRHS